MVKQKAETTTGYRNHKEHEEAQSSQRTTTYLYDFFLSFSVTSVFSVVKLTFPLSEIEEAV
jgi:hypothetical protein